MSLTSRSSSNIRDPSSFFKLRAQFPPIEENKFVAGFLTKVEVPRFGRHRGGTKPAPPIIGSTIKELTTVTASTRSQNASKKNARIIGRTGLERTGVSQHGELIYQVEISGSQIQNIVREVNYDQLLDVVSLQELERFENLQFEQEFSFEPVLVLHKKRRGRPPKVALHDVGFSCDEESESSRILEDNDPKNLPSADSLKRPRSLSSQPRRRGRPKKIRLDPSISRLSRRGDSLFEHSQLPQVKKRLEKTVSTPRDSDLHDLHEDSTSLLANSTGREVPLRTLASAVDNEDDFIIDAGSEQLVFTKPEDENDIEQLDELSIIPTGSSHFKSSQLVAASQRNGDDNSGKLTPIFQTRRPGRPRKTPLPKLGSDDKNLDALHQQSKARKQGTPKKSSQAQGSRKRESSTDDELRDLHEKFGTHVPKDVDSEPSLQTSARGYRAKDSSIYRTPTKDKKNISYSAKPSPGNRPGYRPPSFSQPALESSNDASASSESTESSPAPSVHDHPIIHNQDATPVPAKSTSAFTFINPAPSALKPTLSSGTDQRSVLNVIEISSDDTSDSANAASSRLKTVPAPQSKPMITLEGPDSLQTKPWTTSDEERTETSTDVPGEDSDEDPEIAGVLDFDDTPNVASNQSYRVSRSPNAASSSNSDSPDRTNRSQEIAKVQKLTIKPKVPRKKKTVAPQKPRISMQKISQQVAEQSRKEFEARRAADLAAKQRALAEVENTDDSESSSDTSYSIPRTSLPAKARNSFSTLATHGPRQDSSIKKNGWPFQSQQLSRPYTSPSRTQAPSQHGSFGSIFKQLSANHQKQQQQAQKPTTSASAPAKNLRQPSSVGSALKQPISKQQSRSRIQREQPSSRQSSPPTTPRHREASISLGETPRTTKRLHTQREAIKQQLQSQREGSLSLGETLPPRLKPTPVTAFRPMDTIVKLTDSKKQKNKILAGHRASMTPLFPTAAVGKGSPVKKGRKAFSTREFEGEG